MKDAADGFDINQTDAYQVATRVFVALADGEGYNPRPQDESLAEIYDAVLDECDP